MEPTTLIVVICGLALWFAVGILRIAEYMVRLSQDAEFRRTHRNKPLAMARRNMERARR